ncbi:MAG: hypothetical protein LBH28_10220 [Oscillospiraceae bacterium]|nr:hypothetical protein [Oscillospiraceae bacterium]
MLTQGKYDNEAGRKKDKQETANLSDREYGFQYNSTGRKILIFTVTYAIIRAGFLREGETGWPRTTAGRPDSANSVPTLLIALADLRRRGYIRDS